MKLEFNDHALIITFDKNEFGGKTVHFHGEQLEDGGFLACPLFVRQIGTGTFKFGGEVYKVDEEVADEELEAMMQAISVYCMETSQKVVFEEITPVPYVPSKGKLIAVRRSVLIVSIEEGSFAGQVVEWSGEMSYNGFGCYAFDAKFLRPPSKEQLSDIFLRGIEVTRNAEKREYPALMQAFRDICETEKWKIEFLLF